MKKRINGKEVNYYLMWSPLYKYDRHEASRILPEMAGILCLYEKLANGEQKCVVFYDCWREGLRIGFRHLFDPIYSKFPEFGSLVKNKDLFFKYTIVDSNVEDAKDILYWLLKSYQPELNIIEDFKDSGRYKFIRVKEMLRKKNDCIEKFPKFIPK